MSLSPLIVVKPVYRKVVKKEAKDRWNVGLSVRGLHREKSVVIPQARDAKISSRCMRPSRSCIGHRTHREVDSIVRRVHNPLLRITPVMVRAPAAKLVVPLNTLIDFCVTAPSC